MASQDRYVVISTDTHCGAPIADYKPYLEARWHDEFDAWAGSYRDGWEEADSHVDPDLRLGTSPDATSLNWDSGRRQKLVEQQGIAAEVLLPNTAPPFYPSHAIAAPAPRTSDEYEHRWAGIKAHNRWLVDFCAEMPGRRAGVAQVFLENVDDTVTEIRWAKEAGLQGILLPAPHVLKMINLYYPAYDPVWAACEALDIPVVLHDVVPTESPMEAGWGSLIAQAMEINFYTRRQIGHLIGAAVFERFPNLRVAATEMKDGSVVPSWLEGFDVLVAGLQLDPVRFAWAAEAAKQLTRAPSEYFASNVYIAGNLDVFQSIEASAPNLMFGADLPHGEGTVPYTKEVLRLAVADLPEADRRAFLYQRAVDVYGFDLDLLQRAADTVGPLVDEVRTPLPTEEIPRFPEDTRSMALCVVPVAKT